MWVALRWGRARSQGFSGSALFCWTLEGELSDITYPQPDDPRRRNGVLRVLLVPALGAAAVAIWWAAAQWTGLPEFILPGPVRVVSRFLEVLTDGSLIRHTMATGTEVALGLIAGTISAITLGYLLAKSPTLERLLSPYVVASQAIPIVAIAPLLIIWFGPGRLSKILIAALIVFFPILINTIVGIRSVPADLYNLMRSMRATRWQTFAKLELPAALPVLLGGLKVGATLSVIGAVVGEFVAAEEGLGFLINLGRGMYDTALVFVAVFVLVALALSLYGVVALLEASLVRWRRR